MNIAQRRGIEDEMQRSALASGPRLGKGLYRLSCKAREKNQLVLDFRVQGTNDALGLRPHEINSKEDVDW